MHLTRERVGTNYSWRSRYDWLPVGGFHVCTEFVPNRRITFKSSRSYDGQVTYSFEPEGTGTTSTMSVEPPLLLEHAARGRPVGSVHEDRP